MEDIANKFKKLGTVIAGIGAGLAASGAATLAPLLGLFREAAGRADDIQDIADRLDATTESVSRLGYVAEFAASNLQELEGAAKMLGKATQAAAKGGNEQAAAFDLMGVSAEEFAAMDLDKKFLVIAEAFDSLSDPLQKNRLLLALFGKQGAQMKPLFMNGADGIREWMDEADKVGATVNGMDAKKAATVMDALDRSMKAVKYGFLSIGAAIFDVAGGVENASRIIVNIVATVRSWIERNRVLVLTITAIAIGAVAVGGALVALGIGVATIGFAISGLIGLWTALGAAFTFVIGVGGAIIGAVFSPIGIAIIAVTALVVGLVALFLQLGDSVGALSALTGWFNGLYDTFMKSVGGIMNALKKGDFNLAWEIALKGMETAWAETVLILVKLWNGFKRVFVDGFKSAVAGVKMLFVGFFDFMKLGFLGYIKFILDKFIWLSNKVGATDFLKGQGIDLQGGSNALGNEIQSTVDALEKKLQPIKDGLDADLAARAADRQKDVDSQQAEIDRLKGELDGLVAKAAAEDEADKKDGGGMLGGGGAAKAIEQLGRVVAGTFRSADYRGSLGLQSMVKEETKKQTKIQEDIRDGIGDMNDKLDDMEGAEFE